MRFDRSNRRIRPLGPILVLLTALLPLLLPQPAAAQATDPAESGVDEAALRVVVAVLPFRVNSARPLGYLENSLADLLATRLEASGRIEVVESMTVRETLVAYPGERTEDAVRRIARELGADYVVVGSLTELAGRYSLDVRLTPVDSRVATSTMTFTAEGEDALLDRVNELASRILGIVGTSSARARVAEIRVEGAPRFAEEARRTLRLRPGDRYDSAIAREDVGRLQGLRGVARATVETERGPEGVSVIYRLVSADRLLPQEEALPSADRVAEVRIEGNRRIEEAAIRARIATKAGEPLDPRVVSRDVREIHGLGFFRDVRVTTAESIDGRILTFHVEENPVIRQVSVAGNDALSGDKIRDTLTLTTGSTLDYPLLFENRERIEGLYRAEGYYLADVDYEIQEMPNEAVAVNFEVDEGGKLKLREIDFVGNEHFSDEDLRRGLQTKSWHWYSWVTRFLDRSGTYSEPVFLQDLQTVTNKYLDAGFIKVDVSEPDVDPVEDGLVVEVRVDEGDRYKVGSVDVAGDETLDLEGLREDLQLSTGDYFSRSGMTNDREAVQKRYTDRGFFLAEVAPVTRVDEDARAIDVTFEVEKGTLYFLRQIEIAGNTTTVDPVIRREIRTVEGELYSARAIALSRARVRGLGFFEEVEFEAAQTDYPDQLDLEVDVVERPTGSLSFGAGFSSQDGFVLSGSVSQSNLFGRGYGGQLTADIGGRTNRFFLSFSDPYFLGSTFQFSTQIFRTDVEFEDFRQEQTGIDLVFAHALDEANRTRAFARYAFASREIQPISGVNAAGLIFREILSDAETTSLVGLTIRNDTRDDRISPTSGRVLSGSVDLAGLGGFSKFVRLEGRSSYYFRTPEWFPGWFPFRDRSTWVFAGRAGWTIPFNSVDDFEFSVPTEGQTPEGSEVRQLDEIDDDLTLPLSERYFLGGLGSYQLRGYKARSVGPRRALLKRSGAFGTGSLFAPVGVAVNPADLNESVCLDFDDVFPHQQGDGDGKCNSLDDKDIDDFDDLDETDVIGGNKFFSLSTEYRFPISESLGLVGILFLDMGNAFAENESIFDIGNWRYGTGFGVQWFSPFGPLQAFVGFPLNKLEVEDTQVFEFSVGGQSY